MKIRPIAGHVLLRQLPDEYESSAGLWAPMAVHAYSQGGGNLVPGREPERGDWHRGEVLAVAEHGRLTRERRGPGRMPPPAVSVGEKVVFDAVAGIPMPDGNLMVSTNALKMAVGE